MKANIKYLKTDMRSGMVVFLIALPLCLGIAVASGAPPFAGIICGVIAGIVVGSLSGSNVSVSGPAAGLIAILLTAITDLGYESFLVAVVIAGILQLAIGFAKAGSISSYFPTSVIEGMLVAIGIIIILKELPNAIGYDQSNTGHFTAIEQGFESGFFAHLLQALGRVHWGAVIIAFVSIGILIAFNTIPFLKRIKAIPGALVVVAVGIMINELFKYTASPFMIAQDQLVTLPTASSLGEFFAQFTTPDFGAFANPGVWVAGATIAIVASIETLLCLEAGDKMDPQKRYSCANREMKAQGVGNILSGLIGGLPMTSVIVRTSANVNSGARTKLSAVFHGIFLLTAVILIPGLMNKIPMASLSGILIMIGIKLASPKVFKHMWHTGKHQFIPFIATVIAVVLTDLLTGVGIGLAVAVVFILRRNMKLAYFFKKTEHQEGETIMIDLAQEVSFLNKAAIKQTLAHLPANSKVVIGAANTVYIDHDVLELIRDFVKSGSKDKNLHIECRDFKAIYNMEDSHHVYSKPARSKLPSTIISAN